MKRSNIWRSPHGDLWEARNGGVDFGLDDGSAFRLYADGCAQYREEFYTPSPNDSLVEAWEVLIGDPLPAPVKAVEAQPKPPKKRPRKFRDSDGDVWIRGFGRGEVLFKRSDGSMFGAYVKKGKVNYTDDVGPSPYQDDECADQVRAAIAALWLEKGSK